MSLSRSFEPGVQGPFKGHFLVGQRLNRTQRVFSIYDDNGVALPGCDIRSEHVMSVPEGEPNIPAELPIIDQPTLFAGVARDQFGHVILNCLGRLWALDELPKDTKLVFWNSAKRPNQQFPFIRPFLDLLGVENDIEVRFENATYSELYTASNVYGEALGGLGTPRFHAWIDDRLPPAGPVDPDRRIYLTRSALGPSAGRYACEDHLETLLKREGYEIIAPESLSFAEQIALFQNAGKLIFAEGSALHLYAMVRRENQQAAVIQRRAHLPRMMLLQMNDRRGLPVEPIETLKSIYWPPKRSDHFSVAFLDFEALRARLIEYDLISPNAFWDLPDQDMEQVSLNAGLAPGEEMLDESGRRKWLRKFRRERRAKRAA
ncbi:glycosyltransferase family 61 protein [Cognatishimia activa]|uniref:Capsular polysaccharide biosynthesis protein n=1 Tax=Cognatishimia activa TaxID=1715691 RepID=A0A0P1IY28_9RHOB|nr:glycosyltransferase family 61 protein [Cognatishimia activa]CUI76611.1 Capsular polysaccharide biosynthesis protein [Cognatishimia activa]CUK26746.1 Capsular polysaccharide biosynthesis protein [Cognatishimia activa]